MHKCPELETRRIRFGKNVSDLNDYLFSELRTQPVRAGALPVQVTG